MYTQQVRPHRGHQRGLLVLAGQDRALCGGVCFVWCPGAAAAARIPGGMLPGIPNPNRRDGLLPVAVGPRLGTRLI